MFRILHLPTLLLAARAFGRPHGIPAALQSILDNTHGSNLYTYPTDLTRDIIPKAFHSHNDYWRDVPFYSAISNGGISVEADVWLYNGTLHVGHDTSSLTEERTLQSLYLEPLVDTLVRQNPTSRFIEEPTNNGVFDASVGQTLYLWVDIKTDGNETLPYVLEALEPLLDAGYLTTTDGETVTEGPVTIIGTGNTPRTYFLPTDPASADSPRFIFYDAQLATLDEEQGEGVTSLISPIASTAFGSQIGEVVRESLNDTQLEILRGQIGFAKERGIGARYWDTPNWPIGTRNAVWRTLLEEGVALVGVDDVTAAAEFWEASG